MASKHFEGQLLEPIGDAASNDKLRFTHTSTTGQTIGGAQSVVTIDAAGFYNFDLEYGIIQVEYFSETANRWRVVGSVTINSDITATTITALLNAVTPATPELVLELQQILSDADQIVVDAQNSADAAAQSATDAANSAVENGKVIKSILVSNGLSGEHGFFADGFTISDPLDVGIDASFQFWKYVGAETLPYAVPQGTDPSAGDWELVKLNNASHIQTSFGASVELELFKSYESLRSETVRVPSDFPDLQAAFDSYANGRDSNVQVTVLIEAGHKLTKGLSCTMGDFGRFEIKSEDHFVYLDPTFVGVPVVQNPTNGEVPRPPLCYGFHARMPRWNILVDMENKYGSGLLLINCSTYCVADYGVINSGFRGWQQRAGYGFASNTNFSGATGCAARVQKAGICNLGDADLSNACKTEDQAIGALYVSRSCMVEARGATVANSGAAGVVCRRSTVTCVDVDASNCTLAAFDCQQGMIDAVNSIVNNPQLEAYYSKFGGTIVCSGGKVTNPNVPSRVFVCTDGATMVSNGGTQVDGVSINESHLHFDVPLFNTTFGDGIHFNPDYQGVFEAGSNPDGSWIKYANGRMVAETGLKNIDVTVAPNAFSPQLTKPALPATFTTVNHISEKVVGKSAAGGGGIEIFVNSCSNMSATGNEWKIQNLGVQVDGTGTGQTVESVQIRMQVTGTWK